MKGAGETFAVLKIGEKDEKCEHFSENFVDQ